MTEAEKEKYKAYDRMMRAVPNMKPRYSGIMIPPRWNCGSISRPAAGHQKQPNSRPRQIHCRSTRL